MQAVCSTFLRFEWKKRKFYASSSSRERMFDILFQQRFNTMIPAGLPDSAKARVAHKTGRNLHRFATTRASFFLPNRAPYMRSIVLTEYAAAGNANANRQKTVAAISAAVYDFAQSAGRPRR